LVLTVWKWSFYTCDENNPEDEISLWHSDVVGEQKNNELPLSDH
jgi:hypothetical protein